MMYKTLFLLILTHFFFESIFSQYSKQIDSLIQSFLVENKILDTVIFNQKNVKNVYINESNYYTKECIKIKVKGQNIITGIKFRGNSSFRDFVLIDLIDSGSHKYFFIGKDGFIADLKKIKDLLCLKQAFLLAADKKKILGVLMNVYIDAELKGDCNPDSSPNYIL